ACERLGDRCAGVRLKKATSRSRAEDSQIARISSPEDTRSLRCTTDPKPDRVALSTCQPWRSTSARRAERSLGGPCPRGRTRCLPALAAGAPRTRGEATGGQWRGETEAPR